jgi:Trypsin
VVCATSAFGDVVPAASVSVTTSSILAQPGTPVGVAEIVVPSSSAICGNDLALLLLASPITIASYAWPAIDPPMTDHSRYGRTYAAIGYGIDSPTDLTSASAGVRRIRNDIALACVPGDSAFADCSSDLTRDGFVPGEFEGGGGTCDGDSGSGAFDQGNFDLGNWVAFGVLSRGGSNADGGSCASSIYTRFDAWGDLLAQTAATAAARGGYTTPGWAQSAAEGGAIQGTLQPEPGPSHPPGCSMGDPRFGRPAAGSIGLSLAGAACAAMGRRARRVPRARAKREG